MKLVAQAERTVLDILTINGGQMSDDALYRALLTRSHWWKLAWVLPISPTAWVCSRLVKKGLIQAEQKQLYYAMRKGEEGSPRLGGTIPVYLITEKGREAVISQEQSA